MEWLPLGIRVNAVSPLAYVISDMTRTVVETRPDVADAWLQRTPPGIRVIPVTSAHCAYLASSASRFVVGQSVVIDAGTPSSENHVIRTP